MLSPPLLAEVTIAGRSDNWLSTLRSATSWLVRRAAGRVQQLAINLSCGGSAAEEADAAEAAVLIAGALAAADCSGTLHKVTVWLDQGNHLPLGGWSAGMSGLQRLGIKGIEGRISVSGDLRGLTALQSLTLHNGYVDFTAGARLPPSLTFLSLGQYANGSPLPQQVGRCGC